VAADAAQRGMGASGRVGRLPDALKPRRAKRVGIFVGGGYVAR
jgi:hypothetical protein